VLRVEFYSLRLAQRACRDGAQPLFQLPVITNMSGSNKQKRQQRAVKVRYREGDGSCRRSSSGRDAVGSRCTTALQSDPTPYSPLSSQFDTGGVRLNMWRSVHLRDVSTSGPIWHISRPVCSDDVLSRRQGPSTPRRFSETSHQ
jgi:hypothetical protein